MTTTSFRWRNWAGNQVCSPVALEQPGTDAELVEIAKEAAAKGTRVKVVGAGHSFTDIACTDGVQVSLDNYDRVLYVDRERARVTVQAGIRLWALNEALAARGLALENLGDIAYQSIAGAISTSTHGTGANFGGLATQVVGLDLICADGSVVSCSAEEEPETFHAARVGLGALGVLSTVTLQCVPGYNLRAVEEPMRVDHVLEHVDEYVAENDHFEFYWVPHTGWALTKRNNRTNDEAAGRSRFGEFRDRVLLENLAFGATARVGRLRPAWIPRLARILPSTGRTEYVERSYRVFASPRYVHFYEMEYSIPRQHAVTAVSQLIDFVRTSGLQISFLSKCVSPRQMTYRCQPQPAASPPTSPFTSTAACPTSSTSAAWKRSWTSWTDVRTGANSTTSQLRHWPRSIPSGTSGRAFGAGWTLTVASPTPTPSACSDRSPLHERAAPAALPIRPAARGRAGLLPGRERHPFATAGRLA